ncbi:hypothetical protein CHCC19466_1383 [Bacillus licheniformis]|uniref:hypothetical protein n=1 Tax=Bacillus licheniformis TaxID=1402 RepID=UPI0003012092|nr:hypothetical protein [Bacillus licheniformis]MBU8781604.1 hypothetical protein [Bacillus licheniformis]MBU8799450.1 hypothetical protein [Bacillus licheniformis]TWK19189.1 hypothetical protein CHCC20373_2453 [Bacillus licheniformis]TWL15925.1 hypothetical protein CHCC19466_1383 [Bacillus licheniformis]TWL92140.1 hypothetical protein CHCC15291_1449 [Bacillus licheniformis]
MAKTKKYVRIKKASGSRYWYTDKIGEVFEVAREDNADYVVYNGSIDACLVAKEDAELIVTEKRPAKVGEKVLVIDPPELNTYILPYEKAEVVGTFSNSPIERDYSGVFVRVVLGKPPKYLSDEQYEVIINNEVKNEEAGGMKIDLDAMGYDELIAHGEAVLKAIQLRSYNEGYKQGKFDAGMDATHSPEKEELPYEFSDEDIELATKKDRRYLAQERRDEIIERAKADVSGLLKRDIGHDHEFIVNTEKRTVVVLRKLRGCTNIVRRGIAKAAPDDCFNVHIGEAIALHRALGLEVPDEYLNAPQPTEVRVGDVVA